MCSCCHQSSLPVDFPPPLDHADACAPPLSGNESVAGLCPFYSDRRLIDAFKAYIGRLLSHVNGYTGRALKDEPAILGWVSPNAWLS